MPSIIAEPKLQNAGLFQSKAHPIGWREEEIARTCHVTTQLRPNGEGGYLRTVRRRSKFASTTTHHRRVTQSSNSYETSKVKDQSKSEGLTIEVNCPPQYQQEYFGRNYNSVQEKLNESSKPKLPEITPRSFLRIGQQQHECQTDVGAVTRISLCNTNKTNIQENSVRPSKVQKIIPSSSMSMDELKHRNKPELVDNIEANDTSYQQFITDEGNKRLRRKIFRSHNYHQTVTKTNMASNEIMESNQLANHRTSNEHHQDKLPTYYKEHLFTKAKRGREKMEDDFRASQELPPKIEVHNDWRRCTNHTKILTTKDLTIDDTQNISNIMYNSSTQTGGMRRNHTPTEIIPPEETLFTSSENSSSLTEYNSSSQSRGLSQKRTTSNEDQRNSFPTHYTEHLTTKSGDRQETENSRRAFQELPSKIKMHNDWHRRPRNCTKISTTNELTTVDSQNISNTMHSTSVLTDNTCAPRKNRTESSLEYSKRNHKEGEKKSDLAFSTNEYDSKPGQTERNRSPEISQCYSRRWQKNEGWRNHAESSSENFTSQLKYDTPQSGQTWNLAEHKELPISSCNKRPSEEQTPPTSYFSSTSESKEESLTDEDRSMNEFVIKESKLKEVTSRYYFGVPTAKVRTRGRNNTTVSSSSSSLPFIIPEKLTSQDRGDYEQSWSGSEHQTMQWSSTNENSDENSFFKETRTRKGPIEVCFSIKSRCQTRTITEEPGMKEMNKEVPQPQVNSMRKEESSSKQNVSLGNYSHKKHLWRRSADESENEVTFSRETQTSKEPMELRFSVTSFEQQRVLRENVRNEQSGKPVRKLERMRNIGEERKMSMKENRTGVDEQTTESERKRKKSFKETRKEHPVEVQFFAKPHRKETEQNNYEQTNHIEKPISFKSDLKDTKKEESFEEILVRKLATLRETVSGSKLSNNVYIIPILEEGKSLDSLPTKQSYVNGEKRNIRQPKPEREPVEERKYLMNRKRTEAEQETTENEWERRKYVKEIREECPVGVRFSVKPNSKKGAEQNKQSISLKDDLDVGRKSEIFVRNRTTLREMMASDSELSYTSSDLRLESDESLTPTVTKEDKRATIGGQTMKKLVEGRKVMEENRAEVEEQTSEYEQNRKKIFKETTKECPMEIHFSVKSHRRDETEQNSYKQNKKTGKMISVKSDLEYDREEETFEIIKKIKNLREGTKSGGKLCNDFKKPLVVPRAGEGESLPPTNRKELFLDDQRLITNRQSIKKLLEERNDPTKGKKMDTVQITEGEKKRKCLKGEEKECPIEVQFSVIHQRREDPEQNKQLDTPIRFKIDLDVVKKEESFQEILARKHGTLSHTTKSDSKLRPKEGEGQIPTVTDQSSTDDKTTINGVDPPQNSGRTDNLFKISTKFADTEPPQLNSIASSYFNQVETEIMNDLADTKASLSKIITVESVTGVNERKNYYEIPSSSIKKHPSEFQQSPSKHFQETNVKKSSTASERNRLKVKAPEEFSINFNLNDVSKNEMTGIRNSENTLKVIDKPMDRLKSPIYLKRLLYKTLNTSSNLVSKEINLNKSDVSELNVEKAQRHLLSPLDTNSEFLPRSLKTTDERKLNPSCYENVAKDERTSKINQNSIICYLQPQSSHRGFKVKRWKEEIIINRMLLEVDHIDKSTNNEIQNRFFKIAPTDWAQSSVYSSCQLTSENNISACEEKAPKSQGNVFYIKVVETGNTASQRTRDQHINPLETSTKRSNTEIADSLRLHHHLYSPNQANKNQLELHSLEKELRKNSKPSIQYIYETSL